MKDTLALHVFVALGAMTITWNFFALPLMAKGPRGSLGYMGITLLVWCVILPLMAILSGALERSVSGEGEFVWVKLVSVIVVMLAIQYFIVRYYYNPMKLNRRWMTIILVGLFALNIVEAVYTQTKNYFEPQATDKSVIDLANAVVGVGLLLCLWLYYRKRSMDIGESRNQVWLKSKLETWFLVSYSLWNVLFRSRLVENTSWLMFLTVSIILPLVAHATRSADWLQVRGCGLIVVLLFSFGITKGDGTVLSSYNTETYNKTEDRNSIITRMQQSDSYRWGLLGLAFATLMPALAIARR